MGDAVILLVEDNDDNRALVANYFSFHENIKLDFASNGLEAIEKVKGKEYDLVLMDLRMPVLNGDEATREIRSLRDERFQKVPIIALTADMYGLKKEAGFTDMLIKPFKFKQLITMVSKHTTWQPEK